jgi:hypothetical protein
MTDELSSAATPVRDRQPEPIRPILVVPDTDLLISSYLLQTTAGSALADLLARSNGHILLPEVVELELTNVLGRKLEQDAERAADQLSGLSAIMQRNVLRLPDTKELNTAIEQRLGELRPLVLREPFTFEIARAALTRVIEKKQPSGANNEQFRDCCIWEHCLRLGKRHDIYLVTADSHFYEGRKPENGLATQLRSELERENASVSAYVTLSKLIQHLAPSVPPHDAEQLGRRIGEAARHEVGQLADIAGFMLGDLVHSRVSLTPTRTPIDQLATFDVTYSLIEKTEQDVQARLNPQLTATGSCVVRVPEESIQDVRIDQSLMQWTDLSGKTVSSRTHHLSANLGGQSGFWAGTAPGFFAG